MKTVVGIFAHPDDESFGPGGTLAKLAKDNDVYIICVTGGGAGQKALNTARRLTDIRRDELKAASKLLGIKKRFCLEFKDGSLSNNLYHDIAAKVEKILLQLKPDMIITFEPRGVSGHIDHITVSMVTTYIFKKNPWIKKLMYYCILDKRREKYLDDYFIYFPEGYPRNQIDKEVDIKDTFQQKIEAIKCHKSQKKDVNRIVRSLLKMPPREYFLVRNQGK